MNKRIIKGGMSIFAVLFLLCLTGSLFSGTVFAAGSEQPSSRGQAVLTVRQVFHTGTTAPLDDVFTYRLTPMKASNPMPAGSDKNGYTFTVAGTDEVSIGPIFFTEMGEYTYEISNVTNVKDYYTYDRTAYILEVWVDNEQNVAMIVYNKNGVKVADIVYEHLYTGASEPDNPKKPDEPQGPQGPKTGDETRTEQYYISLGIAGIAAVCSLIYLLAANRRRKEIGGYES